MGELNKACSRASLSKLHCNIGLINCLNCRYSWMLLSWEHFAFLLQFVLCAPSLLSLYPLRPKEEHFRLVIQLQYCNNWKKHCRNCKFLSFLGTCVSYLPIQDTIARLELKILPYAESVCWSHLASVVYWVPNLSRVRQKWFQPISRDSGYARDWS